MTDSLKVFEILKTSLPEPAARTVTLAIQQAESESSQDLKKVMEDYWSRSLRSFVTQAELARAEVRLIRWMFAFWVGQTAVTVGTVLAAVHLLK